jgi:hypothetical protein
MIDLLHIPETPGLSVFLPQGVDGNSWQAWQKPRGFVMATIYAIGPGGGGGGGASSSASGRGGGAGGGSGGVSRLTIPLFLLPDALYIRVTPGGSGGDGGLAAIGTAGNVAFSPSSSLLAVYPSTTAQYLFLAANAGGGGAAGTNTGFAAAGTAGSISATTAAPLGNLGATLFIAGNAGTNGGSATTTSGPSSITQGTASQIYGGAGGAGWSPVVSGGGTSALAGTPFLGVPGGTTGGGTGSNGMSWGSIFPMKIYGGSGGGMVAGAGGYAAQPGAGGGGGAGSNSDSIRAGRGGDGGPGCVIIQCW